MENFLQLQVMGLFQMVPKRVIFGPGARGRRGWVSGLELTWELCMPGWALFGGVILNVMQSCVCVHVCTCELGEGGCVWVCQVYVAWVGVCTRALGEGGCVWVCWVYVVWVSVCTRALGESGCVWVCRVYVVWMSGVWCVCVHAQARVLRACVT